jgi:RNA polymerase sigma-70 factor (ECF subfamily)
MDEGRLVAAAQAGDVDAFNQLVLHYQDLAYSVAYRILGSTDRTEDATQEAFLRAYRALHQFRGGSFKSWLLRIVTNCCYDVLRYRQSRPSTGFEDLVEEQEYTLLLEDDAATPEEVVARHELDHAVQQALATLPEEQRITLILADMEEMPYDEIARIMAIRVGTVKSRVHRARTRLRDFFCAHPDLSPPRFVPADAPSA